MAGGGGGGGPGPGYHQRHVRIGNNPGLLGIRLEESYLFGKKLHGAIQKGLTVERNPAYECSALIIDKESGETVAPLWWQSEAEPREFQQRVTIRSGEAYRLMLFARLHEESLKYFVFQPDDQTGKPKVPTDELKFHDTKEFLVRINYSHGREKLIFPIEVRKGFNGRLNYRGQGGGGSF